VLSYYRDKQKTPAGEIELNAISHIELSSTEDAPENAFDLVALDGRRFTMAASTTIDMYKWVLAIVDEMMGGALDIPKSSGGGGRENSGKWEEEEEVEVESNSSTELGVGNDDVYQDFPESEEEEEEGNFISDEERRAFDGIDKEEVCGYLFKQGHFNKNWKKRWFVIEGVDADGVILSYYTTANMADEAPENPKGRILVIHVSVWEGRDFGLHLSTQTEKDYFVCADSLEEMEYWLDSFKSHIYKMEEV